MEEESLKKKLNEAFEGQFYKATDYDAVHALIIYWEESSNPGFQTEAQDLGGLFQNEFRYSVQYYQIPSRSSQVSLTRRIAEYLLAPTKSNTLLIIHYGGHADENRGGENQHRQAVWASESHESEMIKWFEIQPMLRNHPSDVLVLLDCCYGGQAGRASRSSVPPNVELLAACAMNLQTPLPGSKSFTVALIKELKHALKIQGGSTVLELAKSLAHPDIKLAQTPIHFGLEGKKGTIRLEPLPETVQLTAPLKEKTLSHMDLRLSLHDSFAEERKLMEIIEWIRSFAPRTVLAVTVEKVVLSAGNIKQFIDDENLQGRGAIRFGTLPTTAKNDIWSAWIAFSTHVSAMATFLGTLKAPGSNADSRDYQLNNELGAICAEDLTKRYLPLERSIEHGVMCSPQLLNKDQLLTAIDDHLLRDMGFADLLQMRLMATFPGSDMSMEIKHTSISTFTPKTVFFAIETLPDLGQVIVECRRYTKEDINKHKLEISMRRMQQLAELLNVPKSSDFHTLKSLRWFHNHQRSEYGLIFTIPPEGKNKQIISLYDITKSVHGGDKPTLEQRFAIAYEIGKAILKWHTIGWVHQGISSRNIWFFYSKACKIDYARPFLCGFEYARTHDGSSENRFIENFNDNIYRHPDRQGYPRKSHQKIHDLYAYGILLLEIGLWDVVTNAFRKRDITPYQVRTQILRIVETRLAHHMGEPFAKAAATCLSGDFGVILDDKAETQLAKAFENVVLDSISLELRFQL